MTHLPRRVSQQDLMAQAPLLDPGHRPRPRHAAADQLRQITQWSRKTSRRVGDEHQTHQLHLWHQAGGPLRRSGLRGLQTGHVGPRDEDDARRLTWPGHPRPRSLGGSPLRHQVGKGALPRSPMGADPPQVRGTDLLHHRQLIDVIWRAYVTLRCHRPGRWRHLHRRDRYLFLGVVRHRWTGHPGVAAVGHYLAPSIMTWSTFWTTHGPG